MVVIHVKRSDTEQFLFETTCATGNDELIRALVSFHSQTTVSQFPHLIVSVVCLSGEGVECSYSHRIHCECN